MEIYVHQGQVDILDDSSIDLINFKNHKATGEFSVHLCSSQLLTIYHAPS